MNYVERLWKSFVHLEQKTYAYLIDDYNDGDYDKNEIINKKLKEQRNV